MKLTSWFIDTFTNAPFKGNPSWVCLLEKQLSNTVMQSIATEVNCPVTAFIEKQPGEINVFNIRYFTPITEIPACGHGTLASAKFALQQDQAGASVVFNTIHQVSIEARIDHEGRITMTYPAYRLQSEVVNETLLNALGLKAYISAGFSQDLETLFIEVESSDELKKLQPDYQKMISSNDKIKEVVVTSISDHSDYDYYLRSFCPWIGIDEDPVTGSVHGVLGNFWKQRLNKHNMTAHQASPRGGTLFINAFDNRVEIGGNAVVILKGHMDL